MHTSIEQLAEVYESDGVVRIERLYNPNQMAEIRQALRHYEQEIAPRLPDSDVIFEADGRSVRNLWRMEAYHPYFRNLAEDPQLLTLLSRLVNGEPMLWAVETFNKPAQVGSAVPAHQDNAYFCQAPPDVLTLWVAIDPVTVDNGPVYYVRGSHQLGTLPHKPSGVIGNSMGIDAEYDDSDPLVGTLKPGDAIIHHCQTIHYSAPNITADSRCGLLMVFRGAHTEDNPELKDQYVLGGAVGS